MADLQALVDALTDSKREVVEQVVSLTQAAMDQEVDAREILQDGLIAGMNALGVRFKAGEAFIPEVFMGARAMNAGVELLQPKLIEAGVEPTATVVLGTVKGDMHDIGKNMVIAMLKGVGFEMIDLGVNVPVEKLLAQVQKHRPDVLGLSALLTTTMPQMEMVIQTLQEAGLRDKVKVIVGGAPVNQKFATDIGADAYAADAGQAVEVVKEQTNG